MLGSSFGFLALHGGLEAGTAEIAQAAAVASNASIYAVVQPDDLRWHVPSHAFDPAQSDALRRLPRSRRRAWCRCTASAACAATTTAGSPGCSVASNRELAARLAALLRDALPRLPLARRSRRDPVAPARCASRQPGEPPRGRRRAARAPAARSPDARRRGRAGRRTRRGSRTADRYGAVTCRATTCAMSFAPAVSRWIRS